MKDMNPVEILERALSQGVEATPSGLRLALAIEQALAALQGPEPDWSEAPEWAEWWAVDAWGCANWFQQKPCCAVEDIEWREPDDWDDEWPQLPARNVDLPLGADWRLTVRRRPEEK